MDDESSYEKSLPRAMAALLSLWSGGFAIFNGMWWFSNTWNLFASQGWGSFIFLISPACWIWFLLVSSSWYAPIGLAFLAWIKGSQEFSRAKIALIVLIIPLIVTILFNYLGDHWYPLKIDPDGKTFLRMIPFL